MEIIRKPQQAPTGTVTLRIELALKKEFAKAKEIAARQGIDLTAMVSAALGDIAKAVLSASGNKVTPISGSGSASS